MTNSSINTGPEPGKPGGPAYTLVEDPDLLQDVVRDVSREKILAVDMEADSMHHYTERVCLLQVRANGRNFVIDPFTAGSLSPLSPVFADPSITKIFHGADYDIRSLYRDYTIRMCNLFDTQVAARFLGYKETGLASVLEHDIGVTLEKKYQKADWTRRPILPEMLVYAAKDTRHLPALYRILKEKLEEKGRYGWVEEECGLLCGVRPADREAEPHFLRFKGAGRMDRRSLAVLEEILEWRDRRAAKMDRPPFKVLGRIPILDLVEKKPVTPAQLEKSGKVTGKQARMFGKGLVRAIEKAMAIPDSELPKYPRKPRERLVARAPARINALKAWREKAGEEYELDPPVLLTNAQIKTIARKRPQTLEELESLPDIRHWQARELGNKILSVLNTCK